MPYMDDVEIRAKKSKLDIYLLLAKITKVEEEQITVQIRESKIPAPDRVVGDLGRKWLLRKTDYAKAMIKDLYGVLGGPVAVGFSGGKDSTVILHLARQVVPHDDLIAVFCNTTVEFPETVKFTLELFKRWNVRHIVARPELSFWEGVKKYGFPRIPKTRAERRKFERKLRWCCHTQKEQPLLNAFLQVKPKINLTGLRRTESWSRKTRPVVQKGRYAADWPHIALNPIIDWSEWEVWDYVKLFKLPVNPLYRMGYRRVGCWPCPANPATISRLKRTHPKLYSTLIKLKDKQELITKWLRS